MLTDQGEPAADTDAAAAETKAHRKATARVRTHPEHVPLFSHTFESFGIIDPATVPAFLQWVEFCHGRSDFLIVEPDGRVRLASGSIEGSEAATIGSYVAEHNLTPESLAAEAAMQIIIHRRSETFKSFVVLSSGERMAGGHCFTQADAHLMAQRQIVALRPTVVALPDGKTSAPTPSTSHPAPAHCELAPKPS